MRSWQVHRRRGGRASRFGILFVSWRAAWGRERVKKENRGTRIEGEQADDTFLRRALEREKDGNAERIHEKLVSGAGQRSPHRNCGKSQTKPVIMLDALAQTRGRGGLRINGGRYS